MTTNVSGRGVRGWLVCLLAVVGGGLLLQAATMSSALAQEAKSAAAPAPEITTLTGKVVDLQCFMTGKHEGDDPIKCCAACIRSGVPTALETKDGLVVLGHGMKGPARMLVPLAMQEVEVKGKLYEKGGLKYLDVVSLAKTAPAPSEEEEELEEEMEEEQE